MGILDYILSPIRGVINDLVEPVEAIKKIFGVIISTIEGVIDLIEGLVNDIVNLFSASTLEEIFLAPFKTAILTTIDSVEKIYALIAQDMPSFKDYKELIITPFEDVYNVFGDFTSSVIVDLEKTINDIKHYSGNLETEIFSKIKTLVVSIESIPGHLLEVGEKIKNSASAKAKKLISIEPEIVNFVSREKTLLTKNIVAHVNVDVDSHDALIKSIEKRFENEKFMTDLIYLVVFLVILAIGFAVFYITKSFSIPLIFFATIIVAYIIHFIIEKFLSIM